MEHAVNLVVTLKEQNNKDFNRVQTYLLKNNVKLEDYFKNYGTFFIKLNKNQLNLLNPLKNISDIEESYNV